MQGASLLLRKTLPSVKALGSWCVPLRLWKEKSIVQLFEVHKNRLVTGIKRGETQFVQNKFKTKCETFARICRSCMQMRLCILCTFFIFIKVTRKVFLGFSLNSYFLMYSRNTKQDRQILVIKLVIWWDLIS